VPALPEELAMSEPQEIANSLLTKEEAARYLSISPSTISRLIHAGELVHVKIGKSLRFRREDIDAFIQSKTSKTLEWIKP
jgi:excisionase family DNA binding protein